MRELIETTRELGEYITHTLELGMYITLEIGTYVSVDIGDYEPPSIDGPGGYFDSEGEVQAIWIKTTFPLCVPPIEHEKNYSEDFLLLELEKMDPSLRQDYEIKINEFIDECIENEIEKWS